MKQDHGNKLTSYSPDGRTCYQVEYVRDEGFGGEDGFRIERKAGADAATETLYFGSVKEGAFAQMDQLKARQGTPSDGARR